jgi:hypothetical protein
MRPPLASNEQTSGRKGMRKPRPEMDCLPFESREKMDCGAFEPRDELDCGAFEPRDEMDC